MKFNGRTYATRATLVLLALFVGCSDAGPKLVPASGKITIGGKPAGNLMIQFLPDVSEETSVVWPSSVGLSKPDGTFQLRTSDDRPGAVPGRHRLVIVDVEEERPEQGKQRTKPIRISSKYAIAGTVTVDVEAEKPVEIAIP